ncbi:MAG: hypothetical protein Q8O38_10695 [Sulfurimicrobium sp.]|nr:hypothetical protein [Sulfurimicrobium sp.]
MPNTTSPVISSQSIDRDSAIELNPLIGHGDMETFDRCRIMVRDLGYLMSASESMSMPLNMSNWYQMFEAVSAAMKWELADMEATRQCLAVEAANSPASIRASIAKLDKAISLLSLQPENDASATAAIIHSSTERAFLRTQLAELESGVTK